ncbi:hypothetical protein WN944_014718 [Citrus x changshan-huyou]|uniref:Uncharacterized protein n=1 Tax=Citrus x changshan-huyou TaxID=2935761 RepID=A0AAP0M8D1_9ROSI
MGNSGNQNLSQVKLVITLRGGKVSSYAKFLKDLCTVKKKHKVPASDDDQSNFEDTVQPEEPNEEEAPELELKPLPEELKQLKNICVLSGFRYGKYKEFIQAAIDLRCAIAERQLHLVYGGGDRGLSKLALKLLSFKEAKC